MQKNKIKTKGRATPRDAEIGARIDAARKMKNLSQKDLAAGMGVTFQQLQKYLTGANRISASRLEQAADFMGRPIQYFYKKPKDNHKTVLINTNLA